VRRKIVRWGNSLGLRIPKSFAEEVRADAGSTVDLRIQDGELVIRVVDSAAESLEDLLGGVTPENLHGEVDTGDPVGGEAW
jgi:antitoxin MazE